MKGHKVGGQNFYQINERVYITEQGISEFNDITNEVFDISSPGKVLRKYIALFNLLGCGRRINHPEKIEHLGGKAFELKSKPFRAGALSVNGCWLILSFWKVQANSSKSKSESIKRACRLCEETEDDFRRLLQRLR
ncbi:hypothetical protein [Limisalsivibrio acetivorans]|uniref:hypothetical protein n=1 Tax=Limisalsivibrio acetivorans TaxID=1304888 RepID=UPI0003B410DD|nr:hypothetical protein [Limisalsivibrio acetivorans]